MLRARLKFNIYNYLDIKHFLSAFINLDSKTEYTSNAIYIDAEKIKTIYLAFM